MASLMDAYKLSHEGIQEIALAERTGILIDTVYVKHTIADLSRQMQEREDAMGRTELGKAWKRKYGRAMKLDSNPQLSQLLYKDMGVPVKKATRGGDGAVDKEALNDIEVEGVSDLLDWRKLEKARNYVLQIERETVDNRLHPSFALHLARTYRSSCSLPNFQNMPVRDPVQGRLVRQCLRARPGYVLFELDHSNLEVRVGTCYHRDPVMIDYLSTGGDMHLDSAHDLYILIAAEITRAIRHAAKNKFVFPEFYGSWWKACAAALWASVVEADLKTASGKSMLAHMRKHGILYLRARTSTRRGDPTDKNAFETLVFNAEKALWMRFNGYAQWKEDWYDAYLKNGFFRLLTGFVCRGHMAKNDVTNYPIQGTAFHVLLQGFIHLNRSLRNTMQGKAHLLGQIHDSVVGEARPAELEHTLRLAHAGMVERVMEQWPWVCVPLYLEAKVSEPGGNFFEMHKVSIPVAA